MIRSTLIVFLLIAGAAQVSAQEIKKKTVEAPLQFSTKLDSRGRIDLDSRLVRARYFQEDKTEYLDPDTFLSAEYASFGWSEEADELELISDQRRTFSRHLTYQQTFAGITVDEATVRVNMDGLGRVSMVLSAFMPVDAEESSFNTQPSVTAARAADLAIAELAPDGGLNSDPELVITDPDRPVLAWKLLVWPESEPAEYVVLINAHTGSLISARDQSMSFGHTPDVRSDDADARKESANRVDGLGLVYDTDPLFTSGAFYGAPYVDNDDATNAALDSQRLLVTLPDITQRGDGMYVLTGPYVDIVGESSGGSLIYATPAESSPDGFQYNRADDRFESVMAYYHIDKSQRYVQSLGFHDLQNGSIRVNPQGLTADDSRYIPTQNMILYGTGGVDDAEDAAVIWHEYGHAILNAAASGLLSTREGTALHEGLSDYWAASYRRGQIDQGLTLRTDWVGVFPWDSGDGDPSFWGGRYLNHAGIYPQDVCSAVNDVGCDVHGDGLMWGTTLMEVFDVLGRELTNKLVLQSHYYLSSPVTFADAAQAVIQADRDYFSGVNASVLINIFSARGLVDASQFGPTIAHDPLQGTEQLGVEIDVSASVVGQSATVSSVELTYWADSIPETTVSMTSNGSDVFTGRIMLPAVFDTVRYHFKAMDTGGNETFLPSGAPVEQFSFLVGEDHLGPEIAHDPITAVGFSDFPIILSGSSSDGLGVESVTLLYSVFDDQGVKTNTGQEQISSSSGPFGRFLPVDLGDVVDGGRIEYHFVAIDASERMNETRFPSVGEIVMSVEAGALRTRHLFSEEGLSVTIDGIWEWGDPSFGTLSSPSDTPVLATNADGSYPASPTLSSVYLPRINLGGLEASVLRIWHWFDAESDGTGDPSRMDGQFMDGAVVRYRSSESPDWQLLVPAAGYPGVIADDGSNPLHLTPAFGGFSHGWRMDEFAVPSEDDLEIRFDFATDASNSNLSEQFAGWYIDSMEITTIPIEDSDAPFLLEGPPDNQVLSHVAALPRVSLNVGDDFGVAEVLLDWEFTTRTETTTGTLRMAQDAENLNEFSAALDFAATPEPADEIAYSIRVLDFSDRHLRVPEVGSKDIEFQLFASDDVVHSVWTSGDWVRESSRWLFQANSPGIVSSINLNARDTESNAESMMLSLDHGFNLLSGAGGAVQVSTDGGKRWASLEPVGGYPAAAPEGTFLDGQRAFVGFQTRQETLFDLSSYSGKQLLVRVIAETWADEPQSASWIIHDMTFKSRTDQLAFSSEVEFGMLPNYPNPFSGRTRITVSVKASASSSLRVYDMMGREVAVLLDSFLDAGSHTYTFDGAGLAAGVYIARFRSGSQEKVRTLILTGR